MTLILTLPIGMVTSDDTAYEGPSREGEETIDVGSNDDDESVDSSNLRGGIHSDDDLDVDLPTRSEPWLEWDRFSYHSGGQDGNMVYNSTTNKAYIYGGGYYSTQGSGSHRAYDDMFAYDFDTETWEAMLYTYGPSARYRSSYAGDEKNGKLYVYGGIQDGSNINDLWEFDVATETWTKPDSSLLTIQRSRTPMILDTQNQDLYLHMGQGDGTQANSNLSGFFKVDINGNYAVTQLPNDGREAGMVLRYSHDMAIDEVGQKIYLWGGYHKIDDDNGIYLEELWEYDMVTQTWSQLFTPLGIGAKGESKIFFRQADNTLYIWGGLNGSSRDQRLWSYNTVTSEWSFADLGNSIYGRYRYARQYSSVDDRYVIFGGRTSSTQRSIAYLDMTTLEWSTFDNHVRSPSRDNGIFAHDRDRDRLYYIGPNVNSGYGGGNTTAYFYYFDLTTQKWVGPIYNTAAEDPHYRSDAALCYVEDENAVYMYGGTYTTGNQQNRRYWSLADFWKVDLTTNAWTKVYEAAGPGERFAFEMVYNEQDGLIYFYGGCYYPVETSNDKSVYDDMFTFDPVSKMFNQFLGLSPTPGGRWGAGLVIDTDMNELFLFGGWHEKVTNPDYDDDMWKFNFTNRKWTELDWASNPSAKAFAKLCYDPLTREILISGGGSSEDLHSYRILENSFNSNLYSVPNHGTLDGHAAYFDTETRDIWVFGGSRHGVWKMGVPVRLSVQEVIFNDPDSDSNVAYAMLRPYTFSARVKTVDGPGDLTTIKIELKHNKGSLRLTYDNVDEAWSIVDNGDYVDVLDSTVTWVGKTAQVEFTLMFHWNWSTPSSSYNRLFKVEAIGDNILGDSITIFDFLRVRNKLTHEGEIIVESEVQGVLENGSWTQCDELITFSGPKIVYAGGDSIYPAADSFTLNLWSDEGEMIPRNLTPGEMINFSIRTPLNSQNDVDYILNISGIPLENDLTDLNYLINTDGTPPSAPGEVTIHADSFEDSRARFDNETQVFLTWQGSLDSGGSGIRTYYWAYTDGAGTRNGTPINKTQFELMLPGKGIHTIFIWAEDEVGNLGLSRNSTLLVDMETINFEAITPSFVDWLPYDEIDVVVNITDFGGSLLRSGSIYYRYTSLGLNDRENWLGSNAWKWVQEYYTTEEEETFILTKTLKGLSEGADNYLQIKATDGAGTEKYSEIYNIMVDTALRYPDVELIAPPDGAQFEKAEDVELNWSVIFFLPSDVTYDVYIHADEELVLNRDPVAFWASTTSLELTPTGVTFGTYYWTVIPRAKEVWIGNCTSGVYSFTINDEDNYAILVNSDTNNLKIPQDKSSFVKFEIVNKGQNEAVIQEVSTKLVPGVVVTWYPDILEEDSAWKKISVGGALELTATIRVGPDATPGTYILTFFFNTTMGVERSKEITLNITPIDEGRPPVEEEDNMVTKILAIVILVVLVIVGVVAVYFFVLRKKPEDKSKYGYGSIEDLESELGIESTTAPQPKGLRKSLDDEDKAGSVIEGAVEPGEGLEGEDLEEFTPQLVEEGSEDDWMNLVAKETIAVESGDMQHVPSEELEHQESSDAGKSLSDLLAEMGDGAE
ncbi:MAG: hypothetical protein KAH57_04915 [Thermoplasmata archaeon]|nr:hypothetical protein [Thermoplasmata archaeon]